MKGTKVLFAVCLALLGFGNVWAMESEDAVRAATRRSETNTVTTTRKKSNTPDTSANTNAVSRVTNATAKQTQTLRERATTPRTNTNISTASRTTTAPATKQVSARTTYNTSSRTAPRTQTPVSVNKSRAAIPARAATRTPTIRNASQRTAIARSATTLNDGTQNLRDAIMNSNTKECREVFYNCMDEFCANKDSQLKRCACSSRLHEFDNVKKQLETAEEKMLDFSQRLLTVSMDAEDAAALNIATEGELAFNKKDTSKSKKLLDEISDKLNTKFNNDSINQNLTAISLSLNEDAAFDNIDSLMGASTTLKTGTALYGAALPICREMAAEICTPEQLTIAESGYQMMIEQDCNTVKKSYQTQVDTARSKVFENSALLDMSRLSTYQDKNSDDILTCKRKMLDMLSNTSVCGSNLTQCLDMTGQYINPATGEAFLTVNLANLSKLLTRPTGDSTWTDMPGNETFVQYLNSKKQFLEPAMEHCQDISDMVWTDFIEDALAQIKLAQDAKLEQFRQSCTTLTAQCLTDTATSLEDFDSRALSTFGVIADKTVNQMCADVKTACTALMETTGDGQTDWAGGMTEIATDTTYDTIIKTCREVGRACIIQACKSVSGNFGLCENIDSSINRKAIVNGTSCWQEVLDCVASAGNESIERIVTQLEDRNVISATQDATPAYSFYHKLYDITLSGESYKAQANTGNGSEWNELTCMLGGTKIQKTDEFGNPLCTDADGEEDVCDTSHTTFVYEGENTYIRCVYDMCSHKGECNGGADTSAQCKKCRIAERIWGNCELSPTEPLTATNAHNTILMPRGDETTLLYWFAQNTGTDTSADSCRDTTCGPGERTNADGICYPLSDIANDGEICKAANRIKTGFNGTETNCCQQDSQDAFGNCCDTTTGQLYQLMYSTESGYYPNGVTDGTSKKICIPKGQNVQYVLTFEPTSGDNYYVNGTNLLVCLGNIDENQTGNTNTAFPSGDTLTCNGQFLAISESGMYYSPTDARIYPTLSYKTDEGAKNCTLKYTANGWQDNCGTSPSTNSRYQITY